MAPSPSTIPAMYAASASVSGRTTLFIGWEKSRSRPGCRERFVGGGGGTVHPRLSLRPGLCLHPLRDAERVIRPFIHEPNPGARPACLRVLRRVHESLQGRPEVGLLPTPRRCHSIAG